MSKQTSSNSDNQEIDLTQISKSIGGFFQGIKVAIYNDILFFKRNIAILSSLIIVGASVGYYIDTNFKTYTHEIIVCPNMGGTDYLYSKIDFLSSKLKEGDRNTFKQIGIKNPAEIQNIKVEPILDIYNFVNDSKPTATAGTTQNFELVKLLAEDGSLKDVIKDQLTSKNYPNHKIEITTSEKTSNEEIIKPILKFLNSDEYYNKILKISRENVMIKMKQNQQAIVEVDTLIKFMSYNLRQNKNNNLIYNNENNQLNPLFELKNSLSNEIAAQRINLENLKTFIKDSSTTTNLRNTKGINGKLKLVLPLFLIFGFIFVRFFMRFYKKQETLALLE